MDVEGAYEGGTLAAIVIQGEELESGIMGRAQVALNLVFICQHLQASAGHQELLGLRGHSVSSQEVAEDFEVGCFVSARVLRDFLEIRECAPLALLVGDEGRVVRLRAFVVPRLGNLLGKVIVAAGLTAVPFQATGTAFDVVLRTVVPFPSATDAGRAVDT